MNLLTKLSLTKELDSLANLVLSGSLPIMQRIEKVRRIDEIIKLLTDENIETGAESLLAVVLKKHGLAIRLKPKYDFERLVREYVQSLKGNKTAINALSHALNHKAEEFAGDYFRVGLASILSAGVFIQAKNGGLYLDELKKPDSPIWAMISWLYEQDRFITGPKALEGQISKNDMFGAEDDSTTADEDFEAESKSDLVDPPVDEAGAFYQSVIDGADVDVDLIQKAITYAEQDQEHYLLPEASQVIKNTILNKVLSV